MELELINEICDSLGNYEKDLSEKIFEMKTPRTSEEDLKIKKIRSKFLLKQILDRHVEILNVIRATSDFYLINVLLNESNTFACIGFVFYLIVIFSGNTYLALGSLFMIPQYFVICFISTKILEAGSEIARTSYRSNWLYLSHEERKMMCVIMAMGQKPNTLTAGGFSDVSLSRFTVVNFINY